VALRYGVGPSQIAKPTRPTIDREPRLEMLQLRGWQTAFLLHEIMLRDALTPSQERQNKCSNLSSGQWHGCPTGASTFQKNDRHLADRRGRTSHTNMTPPGPREDDMRLLFGQLLMFSMLVAANILFSATLGSTAKVATCRSYSCSEINSTVVASCSGSLNAGNIMRLPGTVESHM
jgi:hypothetical protein